MPANGAERAAPAATGVPAPQPLASWRAAQQHTAAAVTPPPLPVLPAQGGSTPQARQPALAPAAACGSAFSSPAPGGLGSNVGSNAGASSNGSSAGSGGGGSSSSSSSGGGGSEAGAGDDMDALRREFTSLCCPLTLDFFSDPVLAADGHAYERAAIETWL